MSKPKARQRKSPAPPVKRTRQRQRVMAVTLILLLSVTGIILAQWRSLRTAFLSPSPAPQTSPLPAQLSKEYIYAGGKLVATEEPGTGGSPAPPAPTGFLATAQPTATTSPVHLTWTSPAGSFDHYQIEAKLHLNDAQWAVVNSNVVASATSYDDSAQANTAYLYHICAVAGSQSTCTAPDLTTTTYFHDYPFQSGQTPIRAQHFLDLMQAVNAVRVLANLSPITWSTLNPAPAVGGRMYASHLNDLRDGLSAALTQLGLGTPQYEQPVPMSSGTQIRATQLRQLQDLVR